MTIPAPPSRGDIAIRAVIAALPKLSESASIVYSGVRERQAHRAATTLREITDLTGEDHLISRLGSDSELEALFIEGVEAAVRTGLEAKRRLLSRVVAQAVNDEARVDERALLVLALRDLEAPSIRALQRIRVVEDEAATEVSSALAIEPPELQDGDTPERYHERHVALRVMSVVWREPAPVLAALMRTGVLEQAEEAYGSLSRARKISAFGRQLLNDLRGVGIDSPEPGPERAPAAS